MNKSTGRVGAVIILLALGMQGAAFADNIEGRVASSSLNNLSLVVYDPQGRPYPNQLNLRVDDRTTYQGVSSAAVLYVNDPVSVDVSQQESGQWRADHITRLHKINAKPATKNPPPTMRDVLGNPVVKGALMGAATGAIASSASGGKAGKGALVGAGVGAAAGLLENMFSQNSQSSSSDNQ